MRYFCLYGLIEYACVNILPQITLITQRECSKLHYLAEKDRLVIVVIVVIGALGFVVRLRHLRDLRETLGFLFGGRLSTLM